MQISKSLLLGCAAVLCILQQSVRAADTDAQVKAREALRDKMSELQGQPGTREITAPAGTTSVQPATPAPQKKKTPPVAKKSKPATKPAPPAKHEEAPAPMQEVVVPPPVDSASTARERDAVRKKMDELLAQPASEKAKPIPSA